MTLKELNEAIANNTYKSDDSYDKFGEDLIATLMETYGFSKEVATIVQNYACNEGESYGENEILSYATEFSEMVRDVLKAQAQQSTKE